MQIAFRAAHPPDFDYCRSLYFANNAQVSADQEASFRQRWIVSEVRIVTSEGADVGWLQTRTEEGALYLVQLFLESEFQGRGIGTQTLKCLMHEAAQAGLAMTLGVVKTNPARRLYERLGFQTTHEDDRKFYMKRECRADHPA
jgi:ribosomal protein S18 acetylase RimI-like enzyme